MQTVLKIVFNDSPQGFKKVKPSSVGYRFRMATARPPGPAGHLLLGSLPDLSRDWLGHLDEVSARYGDVVWLRMPPALPPAVLLRHPDDIARVLVDDAAGFEKSVLTRRVVPVVGEGLFTSDGALWRRQRRMMQPAFHRARVAGYVAEIARQAEAMVAGWGDGEVRDIVADATRLALRVSARTMFGAEMAEGGDEERIRLAMADLDQAMDSWLNDRGPHTSFIDGEEAQKVRSGARVLREIIGGFVAARRASPAPEREDLLSLLVAAQAEDGAGMSDRQLEDEMMTLLLAGFGASSLALAWTFEVVARHPDAADRLRDEALSVAGDATLSASHLPSLRFADCVARESLRLYPPTWLIAHAPKEDWQVRGYRIPAETTVMMSPWITQRDPRFFDEPERFDPARWEDGRASGVPRFAWFPFGGGPRVCIGQGLAMAEIVIALATIAPRFRLVPVDEAPTPRPAFTLQPSPGIRLRVERR